MIWELGGKGSGTNIYSQKPVTCVIYEVSTLFPFYVGRKRKMTSRSHPGKEVLADLTEFENSREAPSCDGRTLARHIMDQDRSDQARIGTLPLSKGGMLARCLLSLSDNDNDTYHYYACLFPSLVSIPAQR
jgi:hypothetical protein